jgi:hypothetical protein
MILEVSGLAGLRQISGAYLCGQHIHCNGNSVYVFLFWELRDLSPNFHIHVSVSDIYIPKMGLHISSSRKGQTHRGNIEFALRHMNVEIGTEAPIFLFWEYLFQIFGILSLQCTVKRDSKWEMTKYERDN